MIPCERLEVVFEQLLAQIGGRSALASNRIDAMSYCSAPLRPPW